MIETPHQAPEDVRRCARCGQAAIIPTAAWQQRHFGINTGSVVLDLRCQSCGQRLTLQPRTRILGTTIAGVLLLPTCVGPFCLVLAWWWKQQAIRNPVVPGAPMVARRFQDGPPLRRCGQCGAVAWVRTITRNRTNAMPTGTEYAYACDGCGAAFTIESPWGHIHAAIAGSLATAIAVAFLVLGEGPGWRFGGGGVMGFLALFVFAQNAVRLWRRVRNPVLAPTPDAPDLKAR